MPNTFTSLIVNVVVTSKISQNKAGVKKHSHLQQILYPENIMFWHRNHYYSTLKGYYWSANPTASFFIFMSAKTDPAITAARTRRYRQLLTQLEEQGLSQRDVAFRAGVPAQYVSDVKNEARPVTELFARRLHDEFGANLEWLLGGRASRQSQHGALVDRAIRAGSCSVPLLPHPIEGDPRAERGWDGTSVELAGIAAGKVLTAQDPYVLRFGANDYQGVLRKNDLVLMSQEIRSNAEIQALKMGRQAFLARQTKSGWKPLQAKGFKIIDPTIIGHCMGIVWRAL